MIGVLTWTPPAGGIRQKSVTVEMRSLFHLRVAWAAVAKGPRTPEAVVRRRVLTAARRLRKAGTGRLVVPEAFTYGEQLEKGGVTPVATVPLRRALAADLARAGMAARGLSGSARVAVAGDPSALEKRDDKGWICKVTRSDANDNGACQVDERLSRSLV